ncbi:peptidoglycan DD-metalloendopeptidase family protein [Cereibacter sp. SYSU M97828]|nr:peptidoglycan DD-metalloendopeptidase family protein [Cereibacter flavus]
MILRAALLVLLASPAAASVADQARVASDELQAAVEAMQRATSGGDRVAALTRTIGAYEAGLTALREASRQASIREAALDMRFQAKREEVSQLLGVMARMEGEPGPVLLLHPSGPLGTVRSGLIMSDVTPALQKQAEVLKAELQEMRDLRAVQLAATDTLANGLHIAQGARTALSQAISDRTDLPRRFTDDPAVLRALLESNDTLDAFAAGIANAPDAMGPGFEAEKGKLPLPVHGQMLRRANEADAAGVRRPGVVLATRPGALVTNPWAATIRYRGPLSGYGNVMVLEPGDGYLLVLAGIETVYGEVGEVVAAGAPLGLMPGGDQGLVDFLGTAQDASGREGTETLYLELRQGTGPVDPAEWFAAIVE